MNGRVVLHLLLLAGCAASVPVAHGAFGGSGTHGADHRWMHGGDRHTGPAGGSDAEMSARLHRALTELDLAPEKRAKVEEVFRALHERAKAFLEKVHSGELDPAAVESEHAAIVASAEAALEPILTAGQIEHLRNALHPGGCPLATK